MAPENDATPTNSGPPKWLVTAISTALVTLFVAGVGSGLSAWRLVAVHDARILSLEDEQAKGGRYTTGDGNADRAASKARDDAERSARISEDAHISEQLSGLEKRHEQLLKVVTDHNAGAEMWKQRIRYCEAKCGQ